MWVSYFIWVNTIIKPINFTWIFLLTYYVNLTDWLTTSYWQTGWLNSSNWLNYFCIWQTNTSLWLYESDWLINFWLNEWPHVKDCKDLTDWLHLQDWVHLQDWLHLNKNNKRKIGKNKSPDWLEILLHLLKHLSRWLNLND